MHMLRWIIYWLDSFIMMLWLEILGGSAHLSLQDLVGGQFGRKSLDWASMGLQAHRLDAKGPHDGSHRRSIGDLEYDVEDLSRASHAKPFSQEGNNVFFLSLTSYLGARVWWWCYHSLTNGRFEEDEPLTMRRLPRWLACGLWRLTIGSPTSTTCSKCQNVP